MAYPNLPSTVTTRPMPSPPTLDQFRSLEDTIEYCIGDSVWKQFLQSAILSFAWFFDAQQTFITVFADAQPKWSCNHHFSCNTTNICQLPKDSWSWDSPACTSVISEWSLECAGPIITGLVASSFFLGCLVGGLVLATLADSFLGRKKMLVICCLLMSLAGVLTAVSTNMWMYTGLRFISGFGRSAITTCALVHASELVGKKWREKVGTIGFLLFNLGFLSLPIIGFSLRGRSWRLIYLWTCCPCVVYSLIVYFSVHESPRWLFIKGRKEEFTKTLRSMASLENRSNLTESFFGSCVEWSDQKPQQQHIYSALKILLKKRWAFQRVAALMVVGFGIGMVYYGMPLGIGNLSFNLYLSATFNALSQMSASLFTFFFIGKLKRKGSLLGLALLSGICSVTSVLAKWKGMQMGLALLSFSSADIAFNVILIYTLELFPTCVRNSAVSIVREAILLGGVLGQMLAAIGRKNSMLSYGVFGITIVLCGLLAAGLPETKGRVLCDSVEEEEHRHREVNGGVYSA